MSKMLFDTLTDTLRDELSKQLSPAALTVFCSLAPDINAIYRISSLKNDVTPRDIAIIRQLMDFGKKFVGDSVHSLHEVERNKACWEVFKQANLECGQQNENFEHLDRDVMITLDLIQKDIEKAFWKHAESEKFEFAWGGSDENSLIPIAGFSSGPGSCCGVKGVSVLEKYREKWSVSSELGLKYLQVLRKIWKPMHDLPNYVASMRSVIKATFVLKRYDISRLIAPQLNGDLILQFPVESCLRGMLKFMHIDLATQQDKNRALARKGSMHDNLDIYDHSLNRRRLRPCTIDLSSASDLIGTMLIKYCFPVPLFNYMEMCRSKQLSASMFKGDKKQVVDLHMMATMGNAYCFPMQTIFFCALVRAVYYRLGLPLELNGAPTYGVYGDDIIVDVTAFDYIVKTLRCLKMQPNEKKCFSHMLFRESCGGDYFSGYDVRPIYLEDLYDDCHRYSAINRLIDWSARHSVKLDNTITLLLGAVNSKILVPLNSGPHEGLRVPEAAIRFMPSDWRRSIVSIALVDKSFYYRSQVVCSYTRIAHDHDCYEAWPSVERQRTMMSSYQYSSLTPTVNKKCVSLTTAGSSMFPFLRGGISQLLSNDHLGEVIDRSIDNPTRVERVCKTVANWNQSEEYYAPTYVQFISNSLLLYCSVLARCIQPVKVFVGNKYYPLLPR